MATYILRSTGMLQRLNITTGQEETGGLPQGVVDETTTSDNFAVTSQALTTTPAAIQVAGVNNPATVIIRNKGAVAVRVSLNTDSSNYFTIGVGGECRLPSVSTLANIRVRSETGTGLIAVHVFQIA